MAQPGTPPIVGVTGGGGIYEIDGLENRRWVKVGSPFGSPFGALENARIAVPATRDPAAPARLNAVAAGRVLRRQAS